MAVVEEDIESSRRSYAQGLQNGHSEDDGYNNRADHEEEVRTAIEHLDTGFMRRFTRIMFNPTNPFIAGASVLGSVVAAQTAWMQGTYEPLPVPDDKECGLEFYGGMDEQATGLRRMLILGDSLVLGVGCDESAVISYSIARGLAERLKTNIGWRSFGVDGGDARTIHRTVIADVRAAVTKTWHSNKCACPSKYRSSDGESQQPHCEVVNGNGNGATGSVAHRRFEVDVCVVLCGLNDFKKLWRGRTSSVFRRDLRKFLLDIRKIVGPECLIVLPALPLEPTRFPEPLRSFVVFIAELFDEAKEKLAKELPRMLFVAKPSVGWWRRIHLKHGGVISVDGVHPNQTGYTVFGQFLGNIIGKNLTEPMD